MNLEMLTPVLLASLISYGEVVNEQPTWVQREMHTVTNLVRVDPRGWASDYDCSLSKFTFSEKIAKPTLYFHAGLASIAQLHSEDQSQWGNMSHYSSDGTDFGTRTWPYYDGTTIGENVAWNYTDNWEVVLKGWMCSDGHRENIMSPDFEHLGTGEANRYYTQDFGGGAELPDTPVAMAVHTPEVPATAVEFWATWDSSHAPTTLDVETQETCEALELAVGTDTLGGWHLESTAQDDCVPYRIRWELHDGTLGFLPESGAWQYGDNCELWVEEEPSGCTPVEEDTATYTPECPEQEFEDRNGDCIPDEDLEEDSGLGKIFGCSSTPKPLYSFWGFGLAAFLVSRRHRHP